MRNGIRLAMTAAVFVAYQASAYADCFLCHWHCYAQKKRCCPTVPCPTVCNEATFGYFPTQWQPWPVGVPIVTPPLPLPAPTLIPAPAPQKAPEQKMPSVSMR